LYLEISVIVSKKKQEHNDLSDQSAFPSINSSSKSSSQTQRAKLKFSQEAENFQAWKFSARLTEVSAIRIQLNHSPVFVQEQQLTRARLQSQPENYYQ